MRRVLMVVLVSVVMLLWPSPAGAGGPTSVLVTNPGNARAVALYYTGPAYAELEDLLHGAGAVTGEVRGTLPSTETVLNVTWLVHDISIWRTDHVAIDLSGNAWLATWTQGSGKPDGTEWQRLTHAERVRELAQDLGLTGSPQDSPGTGTASGASRDTVVPISAAPAVVVREETRWFSLAGWRWAVPGLVVGALVAGLAAGRRSRETTPRQQLVDREPDRATAPG